MKLSRERNYYVNYCIIRQLLRMNIVHPASFMSLDTTDLKYLLDLTVPQDENVVYITNESLRHQFRMRLFYLAPKILYIIPAKTLSIIIT